jgi:hypothetical protein
MPLDRPYLSGVIAFSLTTEISRLLSEPQSQDAQNLAYIDLNHLLVSKLPLTAIMRLGVSLPLRYLDRDPDPKHRAAPDCTLYSDPPPE